MATQYDIAVVGAGLSGLRTAIILRKQGKRVIVLEANDRVGGRTKGEEVTIGDHSIQYDIGGQWVGPSQERMYALLKEYSVETVHQSEDGLPYQYLHKKLYKSRTKGIPGATPLLQLPLLGIAMKYLDHLAFQVPVDKPWCATRAEEWDSYSIETWMRSSWWAGTNTLKQTVDIICWAVLATEPARVSFLWFLWFIHQVGGLKMLISTHGGAQQDRIVGGASQLSQKMADELGEDLWLSSPVELIEQDKNTCKLTLQNKRTIECSKVVIATSPALSSRIQFNPPLPGCRDALSQGHMMGHVIKTITFYNSPFWRDSGYSGEGVCDGNSVRLTFDASYDDKNIYALVGFFLGDSALQWCDRTMEERKAEVVNYYTTVFGSDAANPIHYIENNWPAEPYVRGAYMSIPPPNVLTKVGPAIREPIGNIHFAGTETATHWSGYMEGALEAAERVTNELSDISTENCPDPCLFNLHRKNRQQMVDYSRGNFFSWKTLVFGALVASAAAFVAHKNGKLNFKK